MLDSKWLQDAPDAVVDLYSRVELTILRDMARRISQYDYFVPSAQHQHKILEAVQESREAIEKELSGLTGKSEKEIRSLLTEAGNRTLETDTAYYKTANIYKADKIDHGAMNAILRSGMKQTAGEFRNLTKTTALAGGNQLYEVLNTAWLQVSTGAFDSNAAILNAIKQLASSGLRSVDYPTGHHDSLEVAVRRAVLTGANQTALKLQDEYAELLGCDLVETTAHAGARPSHALWQGRIFSRSGKSDKYPDFESATGYGTGAGLGGWNCRHSYGPYVEGAPRVWTDDQLKKLEEKNITYNGEALTEYEASQQQRYIERQIRKWKRESAMLEEAGLSTDESDRKVLEWQARQRDFIQQTGLRRQYERENITKTVENIFDRDIIALNTENEDIVSRLSLEDTTAYNGKLSNRAARKWYLAHDKRILELVDHSQSIEEQARQACELRIAYRTQTRDLMRDQIARKRLDEEYPSKSFEELLEDKMRRKGLTREEAILDIYETAVKTNSGVNEALGLE